MNERHKWTVKEIQAALDKVDAVRAKTGDASGFKDIEALGFDPEAMLVYATKHADHNIVRWGAKGVGLSLREALIVGWLDGIMVGVALKEGEDA